MKKTEIKYQESEIEAVFQKFTADWGELTDFYNKEVTLHYNKPSNGVDPEDTGKISRYVVDIKNGEPMKSIESFFENIEELRQM